MKIYLAGSCDKSSRPLMEKVYKFLKNIKIANNNIEVFAPFRLKIKDAYDYSQEDWSKMVFDKDVEAIRDCDIFFMVSEDRMSSAGTNWELGFAYGINKISIVVQINNNNTSLMTFNGCGYFTNCKTTIRNMKEFREKVYNVLNNLDKYLSEEKYCSTVIT